MPWLTTSLFVKKTDWGSLFFNGIKKFLEENSSLKNISSFNLFFNYTSGQNIRFAVYCDDATKCSVAKQIDIFFNLYFKNFGLKYDSEDFSLEGLFKPFPINSIQYGLYTLETSSMEIRRALSQCMLNSLSNLEIDNEVIVTLAFYLHLCLLKVFLEFSRDLGFKSDAIEFYSNRCNISLLDDDYITDKFLLLHDEMIGIQMDIFGDEDANPKISLWFRDLVKTFRIKFLYEVDGELTLSKLRDTQIEIMGVINTHLCLSQEMTCLVYGFISKLSSI